MDPEFRITGESVDSERLAGELADRVDARRRAGVYTHEVESMLAERLPDEEYSGTLSPLSSLDYAATRAYSGWEVSTAYPVVTEKRFVGPFVIFAKRIARIWARIAVGPIQREQTAFNRHVAVALEAVRRNAIAERAGELARESDLAELAGAMVGEREDESLIAALAGFMNGCREPVVIGPCPAPTMKRIKARFDGALNLPIGGTWDEGATTGPISFFSNAAEESLSAVIVSELVFWFRPEQLIEMARRAYLVLQHGGRLAITVHSFAAGAPAPAWCSQPVIVRALELAGFRDISVFHADSGDKGPGGFVAGATRP